jgi:hypothetical protein
MESPLFEERSSFGLVRFFDPVEEPRRFDDAMQKESFDFGFCHRTCPVPIPFTPTSLAPTRNVDLGAATFINTSPAIPNRHASTGTTNVQPKVR